MILPRVALSGRISIPKTKLTRTTPVTRARALPLTCESVCSSMRGLAIDSRSDIAGGCFYNLDADRYHRHLHNTSYNTRFNIPEMHLYQNNCSCISLGKHENYHKPSPRPSYLGLGQSGLGLQLTLYSLLFNCHVSIFLLRAMSALSFSNNLQLYTELKARFTWALANNILSRKLSYKHSGKDKAANEVCNIENSQV